MSFECYVFINDHFIHTQNESKYPNEIGNPIGKIYSINLK